MQVTRSYLQRMIVPLQARTFATASIADRFEVAYSARREQLNKGPAKV